MYERTGPAQSGAALAGNLDLRKVDLNLLVTFDVLMDERNVTRAAERLGRTQSAVSHSLSRLRQQLDDPLMVKMGGGMTPSPFAEGLIEEVRPILHSIQRVLTPPEPFDPATSRRKLRIAIADIAPSLIPELMSILRREAPGVMLEWVAEEPQTPLEVAEGRVDIAFVASAVALPEGVESEEAGELNWMTFARKTHPAIESWGAAAWRRWPHVIAGIGNRLPSPVPGAAGGMPHKRTVAVRVLNFSAVPLLLSRTDLLATLPAIAMDDVLERFGLCALAPPIPLEPMPHRFIWGTRLANDPAVRWIRTMLTQVFAHVLERSNLMLMEPFS
jgi:DNA-binding transcriptional LysR family regulator